MTENNHPTVNWPGHGRFYKVVQLVIDGNFYLRFGRSLHCVILTEALNEFGIPEYLTITDRFCSLMPEPKRDRYNVVGMGNCDISEDGDAHFYGSSGAYNIGIEMKHLTEIQRLERESGNNQRFIC